jgi:hypothetical protein
MGTWGTGLFEDDLALDIKDMFKELIKDGQTVQEAISTVLEEFEDALEDFDEGATVVLALCSLGEEKGCITEELRDELRNVAFNIEYWNFLKEENIELYEARMRLLNKFLKMINME